MELLFLLICGHFLADYPLQADFLARGKNRANPIPGVPFYQCLAAHAFIHGGMVYLITNNIWLGIAETISHAIIDDAKCTGKIGFNTDQALHIICKIIWVLVIIF
jgi:hypothetical protein